MAYIRVSIATSPFLPIAPGLPYAWSKDSWNFAVLNLLHIHGFNHLSMKIV
jgi:hypothetical protein